MNLMRLFLGFPASEKYTSLCIDFIRNFPEANIRWVNPQNFHVTAIFIGEYPYKHVNELCMNLQNQITSLPAPKLPFDKFTYVEKDNSQKMIWAQFKKTDEFDFIVNKASSILKLMIRSYNIKNIKIDTEKERIPHITLARLKESYIPYPPIPEQYQNITLPDLVLNKIVLYQSIYHLEEVEYREIAPIRLK